MQTSRLIVTECGNILLYLLPLYHITLTYKIVRYAAKLQGQVTVVMNYSKDTAVRYLLCRVIMCRLQHSVFV
jgi:hypothetical protein